MNLDKWQLFSLLPNDFKANIKMVSVYGNFGNEALIVMEDDKVYALGSNTAGCLGIGSLVSTLEPTLVEALCDMQVTGFAFGSGPHVIAYTASGETFGWGQNCYSELGIGGSVEQKNQPTRIPDIASKVVVAVACGCHHTLALTNEGQVWSWGQNNCGQIASGMNTNQTTPRLITSLAGSKKVTGISCGQSSSFAVTSLGEVYAWGHNGSGQLGVPNTINQTMPSRVTGLDNCIVVKVVSGYAHTLALTDDGVLYTWGANTYGQLGTGTKTNLSSPQRVGSEMGRIADIAASHCCSISAAINQYSKVYMWGQCKGQIVLTPILTPFNSLHEVFACFAMPTVMYEPLKVTHDEGTSVVKSLIQAFNNPAESDLTIAVEGKKIYVHKGILKIRCEHFRSMFQDHWQEDSKNVLTMDHISFPVCKAFLFYLYSGRVEIESEFALELMELANAYCETDLKKQCEHLIKHSINVDNAALLYTAALTYQSQDLEEFCFKFCLNHMTAIVQSTAFASLDLATAIAFIRKAASAGAFRS